MVGLFILSLDAIGRTIFNLETLLGSLALLGSTAVLVHWRLGRILVLLKVLHLFAIHELHHIVRLPLLEAESDAFVRIVLVVRLVLVILDLNKVRVNSVRIQRQ